MVECLLAKEDVASSSLVSRSILRKTDKVFFLCREMGCENELFRELRERAEAGVLLTRNEIPKSKHVDTFKANRSREPRLPLQKKHRRVLFLLNREDRGENSI